MAKSSSASPRSVVLVEHPARAPPQYGTTGCPGVTAAGRPQGNELPGQDRCSADSFVILPSKSKYVDQQMLKLQARLLLPGSTDCAHTPTRDSLSYWRTLVGAQ